MRHAYLASVLQQEVAFLVGVAIGQCTCCAQSIVAAVLAAFSLYLSQACAAPEPPVLCTK